ncbi:hypothetical protein ES703_70543 [subsurface metagenome]
MKVLKVAMESQRYDLAAHVIIFATLRVKENGPKNEKEKKGSPQRQPKRP